MRPRYNRFFSRKRKRRNSEQQEIFANFIREVWPNRFRKISPLFPSFLFFFPRRPSRIAHSALTRKRGEILPSLLFSPQLECPPNISTTFLPERLKIYRDERIFFQQIFSHHNASSLCRMNSPSSSSSSSLSPSSNNRSRRIKAGNLGVVIRRVCESNEPRLPARNFSILSSPFSLSLPARRTREKTDFADFYSRNSWFERVPVSAWQRNRKRCESRGDYKWNDGMGFSLFLSSIISFFFSRHVSLRTRNQFDNGEYMIFDNDVQWHDVKRNWISYCLDTSSIRWIKSGMYRRYRNGIKTSLNIRRIAFAGILTIC